MAGYSVAGEKKTMRHTFTGVIHKDSKKFLGINNFGIRLRHEVFDTWLTEERDMDHVMRHLKDANFDPEFYSAYEEDIISAYNREFETSIKPKKKSWARILSRAN